MFIVVYFVIGSVRKLLDTPSFIMFFSRIQSAANSGNLSVLNGGRKKVKLTERTYQILQIFQISDTQTGTAKHDTVQCAELQKISDTMLGRSLVTTARRILRLWMEIRPPDMEGNRECIE
jgi:hypothetical protein